MKSIFICSTPSRWGRVEGLFGWSPGRAVQVFSGVLGTKQDGGDKERRKKKEEEEHRRFLKVVELRGS